MRALEVFGQRLSVGRICDDSIPTALIRSGLLAGTAHMNRKDRSELPHSDQVRMGIKGSPLNPQYRRCFLPIYLSGL